MEVVDDDVMDVDVPEQEEEEDDEEETDMKPKKPSSNKKPVMSADEMLHALLDKVDELSRKVFPQKTAASPMKKARGGTRHARDAMDEAAGDEVEAAEIAEVEDTSKWIDYLTSQPSCKSLCLPEKEKFTYFLKRY
jgi:hypothetical protein